MKASIRMVCGGCLRSVEVSVGSAGSSANACPYCGGLVESQSSVAEGDPAETSSSLRPPELEIEPTIDWVETWREGRSGLWVDFICENGWETAASVRFFGPTIRGSIATSR